MVVRSMSKTTEQPIDDPSKAMMVANTNMGRISSVSGVAAAAANAAATAPVQIDEGVDNTVNNQQQRQSHNISSPPAAAARTQILRWVNNLTSPLNISYGSPSFVPKNKPAAVDVAPSADNNDSGNGSSATSSLATSAEPVSSATTSGTTTTSSRTTTTTTSNTSIRREAIDPEVAADGTAAATTTAAPITGSSDDHHRGVDNNGTQQTDLRHAFDPVRYSTIDTARTMSSVSQMSNPHHQHHHQQHHQQHHHPQQHDRHPSNPSSLAAPLAMATVGTTFGCGTRQFLTLASTDSSSSSSGGRRGVEALEIEPAPSLVMDATKESDIVNARSEEDFHHHHQFHHQFHRRHPHHPHSATDDGRYDTEGNDGRTAHHNNTNGGRSADDDDNHNADDDDGATSSSSSSTSASTPATEECDYDTNPTDLYLAVQNKRWDAVVDLSSRHPRQARTWVSRMENDGTTLRWKLLPLHAAIVFQAPAEAIRALLAAFRDGARCKDDQGKLPIHLFFRRDCDEDVLMLLLKAYPDGANVKDGKGRIPLVLARKKNGSTTVGNEGCLLLLESFTSCVGSSPSNGSFSNASLHAAASKDSADYVPTATAAAAATATVSKPADNVSNFLIKSLTGGGQPSSRVAPSKTSARGGGGNKAGGLSVKKVAQSTSAANMPKFLLESSGAGRLFGNFASSIGAGTVAGNANANVAPTTPAPVTAKAGGTKKPLSIETASERTSAARVPTHLQNSAGTSWTRPQRVPLRPTTATIAARRKLLDVKKSNGGAHTTTNINVVVNGGTNNREPPSSQSRVDSELLEILNRRRRKVDNPSDVSPNASSQDENNVVVSEEGMEVEYVEEGMEVEYTAAGSVGAIVLENPASGQEEETNDERDHEGDVATTAVALAQEDEVEENDTDAELLKMFLSRKNKGDATAAVRRTSSEGSEESDAEVSERQTLAQKNDEDEEDDTEFSKMFRSRNERKDTPIDDDEIDVTARDEVSQVRTEVECNDNVTVGSRSISRSIVDLAPPSLKAEMRDRAKKRVSFDALQSSENTSGKSSVVDDDGSTAAASRNSIKRRIHAFESQSSASVTSSKSSATGRSTTSRDRLKRRIHSFEALRSSENNTSIKSSADDDGSITSRYRLNRRAHSEKATPSEDVRDSSGTVASIYTEKTSYNRCSSVPKGRHIERGNEGRSEDAMPPSFEVRQSSESTRSNKSDDDGSITSRNHFRRRIHGEKATSLEDVHDSSGTVASSKSVKTSSIQSCSVQTDRFLERQNEGCGEDSLLEVYQSSDVRSKKSCDDGSISCVQRDGAERWNNDHAKNVASFEGQHSSISTYNKSGDDYSTTASRCSSARSARSNRSIKRIDNKGNLPDDFIQQSDDYYSTAASRCSSARSTRSSRSIRRNENKDNLPVAVISHRFDDDNVTVTSSICSSIQHTENKGILPVATTSQCCDEDDVTVASSICSSTIDGKHDDGNNSVGKYATSGSGSVTSGGMESYFSLKKSKAWECATFEKIVEEREDDSGAMLLTETVDQEGRRALAASPSTVASVERTRVTSPSNEITPKKNNTIQFPLLDYDDRNDEKQIRVTAAQEKEGDTLFYHGDEDYRSVVENSAFATSTLPAVSAARALATSPPLDITPKENNAKLPPIDHDDRNVDKRIRETAAQETGADRLFLHGDEDRSDIDNRTDTTAPPSAISSPGTNISPWEDTIPKEENFKLSLIEHDDRNEDRRMRETDVQEKGPDNLFSHSDRSRSDSNEKSAPTALPSIALPSTAIIAGRSQATLASEEITPKKKGANCPSIDYYDRNEGKRIRETASEEEGANSCSRRDGDHSDVGVNPAGESWLAAINRVRGTAVREGGYDPVGEKCITTSDKHPDEAFSQNGENHNYHEKSHDKQRPVAVTVTSDGKNSFSKNGDDYTDYRQNKQNRENAMAAWKKGAGGLSSKIAKDHYVPNAKINSWKQGDEPEIDEPEIYASTSLMTAETAEMTEAPSSCYDEGSVNGGCNSSSQEACESEEAPSVSAKLVPLSFASDTPVSSNSVETLDEDLSTPKLLMRLEKFRSRSFFISPVASTKNNDAINDEELSTPNLMMRFERFFGNTEDVSDDAGPTPDETSENAGPTPEETSRDVSSSTPDEAPLSTGPTLSSPDEVLPSASYAGSIASHSASSTYKSKFDQIMAKYENLSFDATETRSLKMDRGVRFDSKTDQQSMSRSPPLLCPAKQQVANSAVMMTSSRQVSHKSFSEEAIDEGRSLPSVPSIERQASGDQNLQNIFNEDAARPVERNTPSFHFRDGLREVDEFESNAFRRGCNNIKSISFRTQTLPQMPQPRHSAAFNPSPMSRPKLQLSHSQDSADFFMHIPRVGSMDSDAMSTLSRTTGYATIGSVSICTENSAVIESYVQSVVHDIVAQEVQSAGSMKHELETALKRKMQLEARVKKLVAKSDDQSVQLKQARKSKQIAQDKFNREMEIHLTRKASELKSCIKVALDQAEQSKRRALDLAQRDMEREVSLLRSQLDTVQENGVPIERSLQSALQLVESNQRALREAAETDAKNALDMKKEIEQSFISAVGEFEDWSEKQLKMMEAKWGTLRGSN